MRKWLEGVALVALGLEIAVTILALFGSERLPDRIPVHFDFQNHPDAWGSRAMLLVLPAFTITLYLLFTVVTRFPGAFNYPVTVTAFNRKQLQNLALDMMAWLKAELVSVLAWMQWVMVETARNPNRQIPAMTPVAFVVVFATITFYIVRMYRAGRDPLHR